MDDHVNKTTHSLFQCGLRNLCWPLLIAEAFVGWQLIQTRMDSEAEQQSDWLPASAKRTEDVGERIEASETNTENDQSEPDREKAVSNPNSGIAATVPDRKLPWIEFSELEFRRARDSSKPCVVVYWADWAIPTVCHKSMLEYYPEIRRLIAEHRIIPLLADCSNRDFGAFEWQLLHSVGIDGIPVTLCYPAEPDAAPIVLDVLPDRDEFIDALRRISGSSRQ